MDKNTILICVAVIAIIITGVLIYANLNHGFSFPNILGMSDNQIGKEAVNYINTNKLSSTPASLVKVSEESGLVKVTIKIGTQQFDSYATKDGKLLFPQAFNMIPQKTAATTANNTNNTNSAKNSAQAASSVQKADKPLLEAYVVSSCPYGLQMQRAFADAVKNLPALASDVEIRYIGSISGGVISSMHGPEKRPQKT